MTPLSLKDGHGLQKVVLRLFQKILLNEKNFVNFTLIFYKKCSVHVSRQIALPLKSVTALKKRLFGILLQITAFFQNII